MDNLLFPDDHPALEAKFHGADLQPSDIPRLTKHLKRFIEYVSDQREHSLREVATALGMMETSASARYRQIKSLGYKYEKRPDEAIAGLWHYRVTEIPERR